jgi:hypothetical protein
MASPGAPDAPLGRRLPLLVRQFEKVPLGSGTRALRRPLVRRSGVALAPYAWKDDDLGASL